MEQRFTSLQPTADLPKLQAILSARQPSEEQRGRGWYSITNVSRSEAEVFIYDLIGEFGVTAGDFVNELRDIKSDTITLRINSPGGDVFDGVAIYNACRRHRAVINVFIDGIAASAASFIAMAGDTVTMMLHTQMMIHEAHGLVIGPAEDMRKMSDILDKSSDNIAGIYAERAGGTVEEWRARMRDETWLSAEEAVELGLADAIEGEEENVEALMAPQVGIVIDALAQVPPVVPAEPEPPDFLKVFEAIADEADEAQYALEEV